MSTIQESLKLCCATDRTGMEVPFAHGNRTVALDGRILIWVDGTEHAEVQDRNPPKIDAVTDFQPPPDMVPFAPLGAQKECPECHNLESVMSECTNCNGSGTDVCYACCHETDCDECRGTGKVEDRRDDCAKCARTGFVYDDLVVQGVKIGGGYVTLLERIGVTHIGVLIPEVKVGFVWPGGGGVLMGVKL